MTAFDIETTNIKSIEQSVMYVWQWHFDNIGTVFGRTWKEFVEFVETLNKHLNGLHLMTFVHNLSFEFQFLKGILDFTGYEVFSIDKRKVARCVYDNIEFRCSYILTNMSLKAFTHKMGVENEKLSGEDFDYSKMRFFNTPLSELELSYCRNDVVGLVQAIKIQMEIEKDNLYTLPLTSTGYVRRDTVKALHNVRGIAKSIVPDYETFLMLRESFRGGNTHANRYFTERIITDVKSNDRQSSYPSELCNSKFPMTTFQKINCTTQNELEKLIYKRKKAVLFRCRLSNVKLIDDLWGCPYIPISKCRNVSRETIRDNGRILETEYLETTITDIDYDIIKSEYTFDIEITDCYISTYGMLPKPYRDSVLAFYRSKTELKGVIGQELYYTKDKNKLNSEYGMAVQNPCRENIIFVDNIFEVEKLTEEEMEKRYLKANDKDFLSYAWGVWTTCNARKELEKGIRLAHEQGFFIYTDTDSVKYKGAVDFSEYNKNMIATSKRNGAYATDKKGNVQYMGIYDTEPAMLEFITMGSKKYGYRTRDGELHITISGVNKKTGAEELEEHGGLKSFKQGFVFHKGGGVEVKYNDNIHTKYRIPQSNIEIDITDNVYITDSTYTLGLAEDYATLLENIEKGYYN